MDQHLAGFLFLLSLLSVGLCPSDAVQVVGASGTQSQTQTQGNTAGNAENQEKAIQAVVARNQALDDMLQNGGTLEMWMVLICMDLQSAVPRCRSVPTFRTFFANLPGLSPNQRVRRKRALDWWSPNSGTGWSGNLDPWPNTNQPWPNYNSGGFGNTLICPSVTDQSLIYSFSPVSSNYPAAEIGTELIQPTNAQLRDCLTRQLVVPGDPPIIVQEPFRDTAIPTCPTNQLRVWSYSSPQAGGRCWILQNFQENVIYRQCTEKFCQNCQASTFGLDYRRRKLCLPTYRRVFVYSYCPNLPPGARIIGERIVIPESCTCQSVLCESSGSGFWK